MPFYGYILTNKPKGVLYIGVTNDLIKRVYEHKQCLNKGFTNDYQLKKLVYFEMHDVIYDAIQREKKLKKWFREWKIQLIEQNNPDWKDLWNEIVN